MEGPGKRKHWIPGGDGVGVRGEGRDAGLHLPRGLLLPPLHHLLPLLRRPHRPVRPHRFQDLAPAQVTDGHVQDQVRIPAGLSPSERSGPACHDAGHVHAGTRGREWRPPDSRSHAEEADGGADEVPADPAETRRGRGPGRPGEGRLETHHVPDSQLPEPRREEARLRLRRLQPQAHDLHHVPDDLDLRGQLPAVHPGQHRLRGRRRSGRARRGGGEGGGEGGGGGVSQVFPDQQRREPFHLRAVQPEVQEGVCPAPAGGQLQGGPAGLRGGGDLRHPSPQLRHSADLRHPSHS